MPKIVKCIVLGKELQGLEFAPLPGPLGTRIQENVSKEAYQQWLQHQTMLINEKRLSMGNAKHRKYLAEQMEKYFFGGEVDQVAGYVPKSQ